MHDMNIRKALPEDLNSIRRLFYDTITNVNVKDYNPEQIAVWALYFSNVKDWGKRFKEQLFFVAESGDIITGFCSIDKNGYIDFMFVHKDYQRRGIASMLLNKMEEFAIKLNLTTLTSDVSITARPFFERKGFTAEREHVKKTGNVEFVNTIMIKNLNVTKD